MDIARRTLLLLVPPITLVAGLGVAELAAGPDRSIAPDVAVAMGVAAVGPVIALLVLAATRQEFDWVLVATAGMLTSVGTTALCSLSLSAGANNAFYQAILVRHGFFVGAGYLALIAGVLFSHHLDRIRRFPFTLLLIALLLTLATITLGETVNGARLWLQIGPVQFQPSEPARLLLAAFIAIYLYERRHLVVAPWRVGALDLPPAPYLLPLVGAVLAAVAVLVLQNDLGMAALVVLGAYASVASVLTSKSWLGSAAALLLAAAVASLAASPRVRERVAAWLEPWSDPAGAGFQFVQAEFGLAAGGIFGEAGVSSASRVPEVHTDFILVAVAAQWGWVGAAAVLALAGVIICRCVAAALLASDGFRSLLALSISALLAIQVLLICGGTLRVLPLTGLTLPLVSSGGTSMATTLFVLGIVSGIGAPGARHSATPHGMGRDRSLPPALRAIAGPSESLPPDAADIYTG